MRLMRVFEDDNDIGTIVLAVVVTLVLGGSCMPTTFKAASRPHPAFP